MWFTDKVGQTLSRPALPFSHVANSIVSELTFSSSEVGTIISRRNEQWITSGVEYV